MDLDSRGYSALVGAHNSSRGDGEYIRILSAISPLVKRHDHETPEMWCSRVRDPFRQILKENRGVLSGKGYIIMYGKFYTSSGDYGWPSNYIYCSVCDSLVFIPLDGRMGSDSYRDAHFKSCINGDTISKENVRINEILKAIDEREFKAWQYKQFLLQQETKLYRLRLELFSQSISHSEKDKLASLSYDHDTGFPVDHEIYMQIKAIMAENTTMPSAPNFEPACNSNARQEMVLPISHHVLNQKSGTLNRPTPPPLPQKPVALMGGLERYPRQRSASAPEFSSKTSLGDFAEAYFDSVRKNAGRTEY